MREAGGAGARATGSGLRKAAGNLGLLIAALVAVLLLIEGVLRLFGLASPILYRIDPQLGYEPLPSQVSSRLGVRVYINDVGLRDDEDLATLLRGEQRILVVGNSVTYGSSLVSQDQLFTEVLERHLRAGGADVKVLNGGVAGYSVSQIARRAARLVAETKPQRLVIYIIRDDFRRPPVRYPRPDSRQEPQRRPRLALVAFLRLSLGFVDGRYRISERLPMLRAVLPRGPGSTVPPYDRARLAEIHFDAIEEFVRTAWEARGGRRSDVTVFISPSRTNVAESRVMPNADLVRRFEAMRLPAHDLQQDFRLTMPGAELDEFYHDEVHYRPKGNEVAGRVLAGYLAEGASRGLFPTEPGAPGPSAEAAEAGGTQLFLDLVSREMQ